MNQTNRPNRPSRLIANALVFAAGLLLLSSFVMAADAAPAATSEPYEDERPRVYTNADLARLEPLPQQQKPIAEAPSGEEWDLLVRMLEMEAQRNREARAESLERERMNAAQKAYDHAVDYAEYYGYVPSGYGYGYGGGYWLGGGGFIGGGTFTPTPNNLMMNRLRVPMGQRGVTSAQGAMNEVRHEQTLRYNQPPIGRRP